jgi:hypothetical protein
VYTARIIVKINNIADYGQPLKASLPGVSLIIPGLKRFLFFVATDFTTRCPFANVKRMKSS